jgi:hypothetical protein
MEEAMVELIMVDRREMEMIEKTSEEVTRTKVAGATNLEVMEAITKISETVMTEEEAMIEASKREETLAEETSREDPAAEVTISEIEEASAKTEEEEAVTEMEATEETKETTEEETETVEVTEINSEIETVTEETEVVIEAIGLEMIGEVLKTKLLKRIGNVQIVVTSIGHEETSAINARSLVPKTPN